MTTKRKILLLVFCAVLLVSTTMFGTMAYLTSTDEVKNTFTAGSVAITLDEVDISKTDGSRTNANAYHLIPGNEYTKDPTVHVDAVSEDSWIFVKIENGIAAYEAATVQGGYTAIADQITANGWTALDEAANIYYRPYTKSTEGADMVVFRNFRIAGNANEIDGWTDISPDNTQVNVTAYAVQKDGFDTAAAAWNAAFGA